MFNYFTTNDLENGAARKCMISAGLLVALAGACVPGVQAANSAATAVASGQDFNCALTSAGGVMCWGVNTYGQLGNSAVTNSAQPVNVTSLASGISAIATGYAHSCALTTGGTVKCWGQNGSGQLGNGTTGNSAKPVDVTGLTGVIAISAGYAHTCGLIATGTVKCWGSSGSGQLGNGINGNFYTPVDAIGVKNIVAIATGQAHSCALTSLKTVQCWGYNSAGQLGNGTTVGSNTRIDITGLSDVTGITAGANHTCVKTTTGAAKCWGWNTSGQIGNGGGANVLSPTPVTGLNSNVASITSFAYGQSTCVTLISGEAKCWGYNAQGQLGNGNKVNQSTPVSVVGLGGSVSAISIGSASACALIQYGVQCFGANNVGQLGMGTTAVITFPIDVLGLAGIAPPGQPLPLSPVTANPPTYTWKAMPGATAYRLIVNGSITSYPAAAAGCDGGVGLCTITGAALTPGVFTWYVQGYNSYGDGAWSTGTSFSL